LRCTQAQIKRGSLQYASSSKTAYKNAKIAEKELSKMLLRSGHKALGVSISTTLQVGIVLIWKRHLGRVLHFLLVLLEQGLVNGCGWRSESWGSNKFLS
jgi:hypothetical protein